ncbi:MAG: hypothetical protein AAF514_01215 [Verrucomicrobiota bacterium]
MKIQRPFRPWLNWPRSLSSSRARCAGAGMRVIQILLFLIFAVIALGIFFFLRFGTDLKKVAEDLLPGGENVVKVIDKVEEIQGLAERFKTGKINVTFKEELARVSAQGNLLQVAEKEATETVTRTDNLKLFWDKLDLGTTKTEIRIPAIYRYNIDLNEDWLVETVDHPDGIRCYVRAPRMRPQLPVSMDTSMAEVKSEQGWGRFNAMESKDSLWKEISPTLERKARAGTESVREAARKGVAEFVRNWLIRQDQWDPDKGRFKHIYVFFADEEEPEILSEVRKKNREMPTLSSP